MQTASTIPAVIDWLVAGLAGRPECADPVEVLDGPPAGETPELFIAVGMDAFPEAADDSGDAAATGATQSWRNVGTRSRNETFTIPVVVAAFTGDDMMKPARDLAWTVFTGLMALVTGDPTLGGCVRVAANVVDIDFRQLASSQGRAAVIRCGVYVSTILT